MLPVLSSFADNSLPRYSSQSALFPRDPQSPSPEPCPGADPIRRSPDSSGFSTAPDSRDIIPGLPSADCPPPSFGATPVRPESEVACGPQCRASDRTRNAAAPLVGIARLAASSPAADTSRTSAQRPDYFLLPVRSILNK